MRLLQLVAESVSVLVLSRSETAMMASCSVTCQTSRALAAGEQQHLRVHHQPGVRLRQPDETFQHSDLHVRVRERGGRGICVTVVRAAFLPPSPRWIL